MWKITYKDSKDEVLDKTISEFHKLLDKLKKEGFIIEEVSMDKKLLEAIYPTYMCISCAEATSNNSNLTGIQFGPRGEGNSIEEIMFDARTKGFSELIKRRFILVVIFFKRKSRKIIFKCR